MPSLPNISPDLIQKYQEEIAQRGSSATARRKTASLKKFFSWASDTGVVDSNPFATNVAPVIPQAETTTPIAPAEAVIVSSKDNKLKVFTPANSLRFGIVAGLIILILLLGRGLRIPINFKLPFAQITQETSITPEITQVASPSPQAQVITPVEKFEEMDPWLAKIYKNGVLTLESLTPAIKSIGDLLIDSKSITISTSTGSDGDITINPDGSGNANFIFEGTSGNQLSVQDANLNSGALIYGSVANNSTGYNLLELQSGANPITRFSVDALGNTRVAGNLAVDKNINLSGNLNVGGVTRLNSAGMLTSITGYYQDSGLFQIDQGGPDYARITKDGVSALADVLTLTLDETGQTASSYDTLVLSRLNAAPGGYALNVTSGNVKLNGQLFLGNYSSDPMGSEKGSIYFNSTTGKLRFNDGTTWLDIASGTIDTSFENITSGTNTTATMVVDSGASLSFTGTGTLSTSGTSALSFGSTGQVTFAGNVDATNGLDVTGANLTVADAINAGGLTGVAYNSFANLTDAPDEAAITADNDVYIGGDLEIDGTIYGNISGTINPAFTTGSVIFQGPSGLAEDNANFFWNDTSNRLGLGTTGPDARLDLLSTTEQLRLTFADGTIYSSFTVDGSGNLTQAATGGNFNFTDGTNTLIAIKDQGNYAFWNISGKTDTGDPATCAEGDLYYNAFDDQLKICHPANTWAGVGGSSKWSSLLDPEANLTLNHLAYTTTMNWTATGDLDPWTMNLTNNAGSATTQRAFSIVNALTSQTTDTNTEALLRLDNADTAATGSTVVDDALLVTNTGNITGGITDAIDVSASSITNALHAGANFLLFNNLQIFEPTAGTLTIEDTSGNDLAIFTDQGTTGRLAVTDALQVGSPTTATYSRFGAGNTGHALTTADDVLVSSDIELDGILYLDGGNITNPAGTSAIVLSSTPITVPNTLSASSWLIENTANTTAAALQVNQTQAGDIFSATLNSTPLVAIQNSGQIWTANGTFSSNVANGAAAIGYTFNTANTLTTTAKVASFQNNSTELFYIDSSGNVWAKGSIYADRGFGVFMKNIGAALSQYDLVVVNTTNNVTDGVPQMSATTSAYAKTGFGVVQEACAFNSTCKVVIQGKSLINVDDTTNRGDYLFSSGTAGKATSATTQYDGLLGIATSDDAAAPYQVEMVFLHQPAVSKLQVADKNRMHADYREAAIDYTAMNETNRYTSSDENTRKGLFFDTFADGIKAASNITVGMDNQKQRVGLAGGVTMNATNTDTSGNTYLGSADANDVYYYDRSQTGAKNKNQDSSPQTLVDLGIDPNWYNGVSLVNATASGIVAVTPPANLSKNYNGGLIKATGRYAANEEDGGILITVKSDNEATASGFPSVTFDWRTLSNPTTPTHSGTNIQTNKGTNYTLETGTNDITVLFSDTQYHAGDMFKIASWYLEPETANDRGEKQAFPQRAYLVAQDSYVSILDADTNKLWMRFGQGTDYLLGVDTNNNPSAVQMLNGTLYVSENGSAATGIYTVDFTQDGANKYNSTAKYKYLGLGIYQRNVDPGDAYHANASDASLAIVGNTSNDIMAATVPNHETKEVTLSGWGWANGAADTVYFKNKFIDTPRVTATQVGYSATEPTSLANCVSNGNYLYNSAVTSSSFVVTPTAAGQCYSWTATGIVAPQTIIAVGTDDGASVIKKNPNNVVDIYYDASFEQIKKLWLTSNGELYYVLKHNTNDDWRLWAKYRLATITTNQTLAYSLDAQYYPSALFLPAAVNSLTSDINSLYVTEGTSTIDNKSNTLYVGTDERFSVIHELSDGFSTQDASRITSTEENRGSVKYYTKDYISEELIGDARGMWPLDAANASADLEDITFLANNLTATNIDATDAVSGVRGKATDFNGTDEYLSCTDANCGGATKLDPGSNISVSAWVKPSSIGTNDMILYKEGSYGFMVGGTNLNCTAGKFGFVNFLGGVWACANSTTAPIAGQWYHLVGTSDGTNIRLYINGQLEGVTPKGNPPDGAGAGFMIGGYSGDMATYGFPGVVDEVMITAETLTPNQIKRMYETGERALQSHGINDFKNNLDENGTGNGATNIIQAAGAQISPTPGFGPYAFVASNNTSNADDGYVNKIDLSSDTVVQYFQTTTDPAIADNDVTSLSTSPSGLEIVGMDGIGAYAPGLSAQGNNQTGTFVSDTVTIPDNISSAYLWENEWLDSDCSTCSIAVSASNDGGATYKGGVLLNTDTNQSLPEKEYFFAFNNPGNSLKFKFVFTRDASLDANLYIEKYGATWFNNDDIAGSGSNGGLFTNSGTSVANGSYIEVAHNQNTNDLVANGWFLDVGSGNWKDIATATESAVISNSNATLADGGYVEVTHNQNTYDVLSNGWVYDTTDTRWESIDESSQVNIGDGTDGAISLTTSKNINTTAIATGRVTYADGIAYKVNMSVAFGANTLATSDTPSGLAIGDEVLLINLQGAGADTADVGNYEFLKISNISTNTLTFSTNIQKSYDGATPANQKVVVQRIPQYTNVTLTSSGSITASAWDALATTPTGGVGYLTGIVAFRANGAVSIGSGTSITVNNLGQDGGNSTAVDPGSCTAKLQGNSYPGAGGASTAANGGAGGGGTKQSTFVGSGGGGASYGTAGTAGANASSCGAGGAAGGTYGTQNLSTIYLGSGGGAAGFGTSINGGAGGGIVFISTNSLVVSGSISATGENGVASSGNGGGGGGSGGSIYIQGVDVNLGTSLITAAGGAGGTGTNAGGSGGIGRIAVFYSNSNSGTTLQTSYTQQTSGFYEIVQPDVNTVRLYNRSGTTQNVRLDVSTKGFRITQPNTNTVRLYNYSGVTQNMRLDVVAGSVTQDDNNVSLAPRSADVDSDANTNSIWINKTDESGKLIRLQNDSIDRFSVGWDGHATISGTLTIGQSSLRLSDDGTASYIKSSSGNLNLQVGGTTTGIAGNSSINFLDTSGNTRGRFDLETGTIPNANSVYGTGADGAITVTTAKNLVTTAVASGRSYADAIAYRITPPTSGTTTITRYTTDTLSNGIAPNDELLIINLQGGSGDFAAVGNYEFVRVKHVSATSLVLSSATVNSYTGNTAANQKVVIQRVPNYTNVSLSSSGSLTASAWEALTTTPSGAAGYLTPIVAFRANGTVTVGSGTSITTTGKGYRGGAGTTGTAGGVHIGFQGESRPGVGVQSTAANDGGGGSETYNRGVNGMEGGGGGGYGASGSTGSVSNSPAGTPGTGGGSYGGATLSQLFMGSGGGGGDGEANTPNGAIGGGIVFVTADTLTVAGTISANGNTGGSATSASGSGGGGGAGGSVYIGARDSTLGTSLVTASAGSGGSGSGGWGAGGAGGVGRVRLEYTGTTSGTTAPAASTATSYSSYTLAPSTAAVYGTLYVGSTNTSASDVAEHYFSLEPLVPGEVVVFDPNNSLHIKRAANAYDPGIIGIVSTEPGIILGQGDNLPQTENTARTYPVALSGRVPVKIDPDSAPIAIGDFLTSSNKPGFAQKAIYPGRVVGRALENWICQTVDTQEATASGQTAIKNCGPSILAFVGTESINYKLALDDNGDFDIAATEEPTKYTLKDSSGQIVEEIGKFSDFMAANIKAGYLESSVFVTTNLKATQATIDQLVSNTITTKTIQPQEKQDLTIDLHNGKTATESAFGRLIVKGQDDQDVVAIDASGSATFSGTLASDNLNVVKDATVGGTLYADRIITKEPLKSISSITREEIETMLSDAEINLRLLADVSSWGVNTATGSAINIASLANQQVAVSALLATNTVASDTVVANRTLSVGTDMIIGNQSINTLSSPMQIQSLAMAPIEIMAGLIQIDTSGNVDIAGNLNVAGNINASSLSLRSPENSFGSLLTLTDEKGQEIASINSSGSAKFNSLSADKLIIAGSEATISATFEGLVTQTNATAGRAKLPANVREITIRNPKVTDYTLVYVTPTSATENKVLYVKSKEAGMFKVGFDEALTTDVEFNWWIIDLSH